MKMEAEENGTPYIRVFCVFDKDDWPSDRYEAAFAKARKHNDVTPIWANECFELWYLLHFDYRVSAIGRNELYKKLNTGSRLGHVYQKSDKSIYEELLDKQGTAIENCKRLVFVAKEEDPFFPWRRNTSTNAYEIVEQMNRSAEIAS